MERLKVKSFGPIGEADVHFGDLTLLVGPQASGKSIFLQLLKLLIDRNDIKKTFEEYSYIWDKDNTDNILDLVFGEGMHGIWRDNSEVSLDDKPYSRRSLGAEAKPYPTERLFYIPAQRILSISDGRPKPFMEFDPATPYVLRKFSESLRLFLQNDNMGKSRVIFPVERRLKSPLRDSFNDNIFHNGKVIIDNRTGQKKLRMEVGNSNIPFLTWSAGQKEFMPLLLSFYMLCPLGIQKMRGQYVVIEEPEMGLHPQAIRSVILQTLDLISRGYKVVVSTHSPVLLEFAWAFNLLKQNRAPQRSLYELFEIEPTSYTSFIKDLFSKVTIKTYFFSHKKRMVETKDISSLDAGSSDSGVAEWGGISQFSGKVVDVVSQYVK